MGTNAKFEWTIRKHRLAPTRRSKSSLILSDRGKLTKVASTVILLPESASHAIRSRSLRDPLQAPLRTVAIQFRSLDFALTLAEASILTNGDLVFSFAVFTRGPDPCDRYRQSTQLRSASWATAASLVISSVISACSSVPSTAGRGARPVLPHRKPASCRTVLLLIRDEAIVPFIEAWPALREKRLVHCSGALVTPAAQAAHPLMTFGPTLYSLDDYRSIPFVIDAGGHPFTDLFPDLPNPSYVIDAAY